MKKVSVNLTNLFSQWQQTGTNFWFCGAAFDKKQGTLLNIQEIEQRFQQAPSKAAIAEILNQLNGFFSLVWVGHFGTVAAVDHIRSRPLFISSKADNFTITDNAEPAREFADVPERNPENIEEITDFWSTVPYEYKQHHQQLWISFVKSLWQATTSSIPNLGHSSDVVQHDDTVRLRRIIRYATSTMRKPYIIQHWYHPQRLFGIVPLLEGIKLDLMEVRKSVIVMSYLTDLTLEYCAPTIKK